MPLTNRPSGPDRSNSKKWALPKISLTEKTTPFPIRPSSRLSKPTPPPSRKPEDFSLFKKTQHVAPKKLLDTLNKDSEFFSKVAGGSMSDAKKIKDTIGGLLPKGSSITKDWARRKARELDNAYRFPQSAPKDSNFPKNPKLNRKIRGVFQKYFDV